MSPTHSTELNIIFFKCFPHLQIDQRIVLLNVFLRIDRDAGGRGNVSVVN